MRIIYSDKCSNMLALNYVLFLYYLSLTYTCASENSKITYEHLYKAGVDAYLQNKWYDCIALIEKSLEDYFYFKSVILQCRLSCDQTEKLPILDAKDKSVDNNLIFFEAIVKKALCLSKCERAYFQNRTRVSKSTENDFDGKVPYNYLQLCYFKTNDIEKAASCAYTFLIHNPTHTVMQTNLHYYMSVSHIDAKKIQYLESEDYQELYLRGAHIYMDKKYSETIEIMERSLQEYLMAEKKCRLMCEGPMPELFDSDFYVSIANHFTYTLRCKLNCPEKLCSLYGQKIEHLFSSHFHYLQFSYYKTGHLRKACEAVASYLHLHPDDETMITNKNFYSKLEFVKGSWFTPRKEAVNFLHRLAKEQNLLNSIQEWFEFDEKSLEGENYPTPPPGHTSGSLSSIPNRKFGKRIKRLSLSESKDWFETAGVSLSMKGKQLNGTQRVAFQGLATDDQCLQMIDLAKEGAVFGDGYNGKESPHTQFEMFEGLTVARAATLSQRGMLSPEAVQLFLNVSENARAAVEKYFNLETELFFAYTHLVCRTAFSDSPDERTDLSHPVHADNCILMQSGECLRQSPAYIWRDYSSIVYLNDDFEGGEFIFAEDKVTVQASVKPKCGLMVAFSAGKENLHGVKAVKKGKRCALAMWYTLDPQHREKERDFANSVVSDLIVRRKHFNNEQFTSPSTMSYKEAMLKRFSIVDKKEDNHVHTEL